MTIDPRTPVVVGVAQLNQRAEPAQARTPIELFADVARLAGDDAGHGLIDRVDTIAAVGIVSWPYPDPGQRVAAQLGLRNVHTMLSTTGGNSPQLLINETAQRILTGRVNIALVGGAESMHTRWKARKEPRVKLEWPTYNDPPCQDVLGVDTAGTNAWEMAHQMLAPTMVYPLIETALRATAHRTVDAHQRFVGELWATFAAVAAQNPNAWSRTPYTAHDITTPTPENRMVTFPYTKRMCANIDVDQGAALLLTSYDTARSAGISDDHLVFLHAGADAHDHWWISERQSLARSVAIGVIVQAVLQSAQIALDDVARFDLYSCFPSAVQVAMQSIGLAGPDAGDARPLTVTGGLGFAGGPVNNYPTHAIAQMVHELRNDPGSFGLTTALGWYVTKHSAALWSTTPPANAYQRIDPSVTQAAVDATPSRTQAGAYNGPMTVEATSVTFDRDGGPTIAIVVGLTDDGRRVIANTDDRDAMHDMCVNGWDHRCVAVQTNGTLNTVEG